ncbi:Tr-type G domain-containing protein [Meloidogyne graminicola]|uniref:Tr-type G domain-containing protein n=1 Tax=Meloidogyne graminicola TaxID=189291 RepID=A0A8S9ZE10_9BILA|nr:Tr-type G domain-containing protein [Meloidogyne graminicola]
MSKVICSFLCIVKGINQFTKRGLKTSLSYISNPNKIRNIGIIAHIDAGKTTLTEQLLYQTGTIQAIGFVDDGSTITDFMEIERERGITIQSSTISSSWKGYRINLIDTPGHVDFTVEVERSLRVLDGAITVLDASAGVQAQTLTVWRQANKFNVPSVFFINKMDKPCADLNFCVSSIEERLNTKVIPIVLPFFDDCDGNFKGFIDVLNNRFLKFTKTDKLYKDVEVNQKWIEISNSSQLEQASYSGFENICFNIADVDEEFEKQITKFQNFRDIPMEEIINALRRSTLSKRLSPIVCGSALHCSASVLPVLDMVIDFLPSPSEIHSKHDDIDDEYIKSCGLVFKVRHDTKHGQLNYVRLFKGEIDSFTSNRRHSSLINANTDERQNNYKIFTPFSDYLQPTERVNAGNIAVFTGLIVEDPSLQLREDPNTGQKILEGMGELQIEVLRERLLREYKLDVFIGPLRVYLLPFSGRLQPTLLSACSSRCLTEALKKSSLTILEPLMKIEITIIAGISGFPDVDVILQELAKRRTQISGVDSQRKTAIITASIPLSETIGLSRILRTISSGLASFYLEQKGYQTVESKNVCFNL